MAANNNATAGNAPGSLSNLLNSEHDRLMEESINSSMALSPHASQQNHDQIHDQQPHDQQYELPLDQSLQPQEQQQQPTKPTRKRRRTVISCTECHRRKQKCDRQQPCSNCVSRGKTAVCTYEAEATIKRRAADDSANYNSQLEDMQLDAEQAAQQLRSLGYSNSRPNGHSGLGLLDRFQGPSNGGALMHADSHTILNNSLREKYKALIRQLPSKLYIDQLIETFFHDINWHYSSLDRYAFNQLLTGWQSLSFQALNRGPQELPPDLRFFPALLFQVLALAVQFHNPTQDKSLDALKYVQEMTLDDLASDYSESGANVLQLLGKAETTLVTVQAGFLRTSFLKNSGSVPDAWHSLGATILDAQEIGLHKSHLTSNPPGTPDKILENIWHLEDRRRMWAILSCWDPHMALILNRPSNIQPKDFSSEFPVDIPLGLDRRVSAPQQRTDNDAPTPLTMAIYGFHGMQTFRDILAMESDSPPNYGRVELIHQTIMQSWSEMPTYFRSDHTDTRFDNDPCCYWLREARPLMETMIGFQLLALHRPYVFTIEYPRSRYEALKAALIILRAQRHLFSLLEVKHYKMFNLVLSTFDAIVFLAAIYMFKPQEHSEYLNDTLQHYEWALERFNTMSERNQMARGALGVLQAMHIRLTKVLGRREANARPASPTSSLRDASASSNGPTASSHTSQSRGSSDSGGTPSTIPATAQPSYDYPAVPKYEQSAAQISASSSSYPPPPTSNGPTWGAYGNTNALVPNYESNNNTAFDFGNMAPLQPMHDLLYKDLAGMIPDSSFATQGTDGATAALGQSGEFYDNASVPWQFEGDYGSNSFWNFMNSYPQPQ